MSDKPKKIDAFIVAKAGSKVVFVNPDEIKKLVRRGLITGDDLVYRKNLKVWTPARDVKGLRSLIKRIESGELPLSKSAIQPALADSGKHATPQVREPQIQSPPIQSNLILENPITPVTSPTQDNSKKLLEHLLSKNIPTSKKTSTEEDSEAKELFSKRNLKIAGLMCVILLAIYCMVPDGYPTIPKRDLISGKVFLDKKPLTGGAVIIEAEGREFSSVINPIGNFTIKDPPKGSLKFKLNGLEPMPGSKSSKPVAKIPNGPSIPDKYLNYGNGITLNYKGGLAVLDISMQSK